MQDNQILTVSVIVCAYTTERWQDLIDAIASLQNQTVAPDEIIVVIDHNSSLFERSNVYFRDVRGDQRITVLENHEQAGLSGARNSGLAKATGTIIAFLDDDAIAAHDWIEQLIRGFADTTVMGVGGKIIPLWDHSRPSWFPDEFDWVVGCTYRGMPEQSTTIRNLIGANMSFRREVFERLGGFRNGVGQVGNSMLRCDDTEFCIRVGQQWPQSQLLYLPEAMVYHHVPLNRARWHYFRQRCYTEGLAKALITNLVGTQDGLASEWSYTLQTLPKGVQNGLVSTLRTGNIAGMGRAFAITAGLALTTYGYLLGRLLARQTPSSSQTLPLTPIPSPTLSMEKHAL